MASKVLFTVELRGQTVGVWVSQDNVSLADEEGSPLDWRLADDEWHDILSAAESNGHEYDFWVYRGGQEEPEDAQKVEDRDKVRRTDLKWARDWSEGKADCPRCQGTQFVLVDVETSAALRHEIFRCTTGICGARWKIKLREEALSVLNEGSAAEDAWIELHVFNPLRRMDLSERETATIQAALRYWRREGPSRGWHERDIETDFDRLQPLSSVEFEALLARVPQSVRGRINGSTS